MTYADKLRDPRWQKKRLEIFERDKWTCQGCNRADKPLNVHHLSYRKDAEPWEYEASWLKTLCEDCHHLETERLSAARVRLTAAMVSLGIEADATTGLAYLMEMSKGLYGADADAFLERIESGRDPLAELWQDMAPEDFVAQWPAKPRITPSFFANLRSIATDLQIRRVMEANIFRLSEIGADEFTECLRQYVRKGAA